MPDKLSDIQNWVIAGTAIISGIFTACATAITAFINFGKKYQRTIDKNEELETLIKDTSMKQNKMENEFDRRFREVLGLFSTSDGEPNFITYRAHDIIAKRCQDMVNQKIDSGDNFLMAEIRHVKEICERIEESIEKSGKIK